MPLPARERWTQDLVIREDGGIRYYDSHLGEPGPELEGATMPGLYLELVLMTFREVLAFADELSRRYGFAGAWHLGVAVTGISGVRPIAQLRTISVFGGADTYTRPSYSLVSSASVREIEANPGRVTERLLGRLFRSLSHGKPYAFTDSA